MEQRRLDRVEKQLNVKHDLYAGCPPSVFKRNSSEQNERGFQQGRSEEAGSSLGEASKLGILTDLRRKTVCNEDVDVIKILLEDQKRNL